MEERASWQLFRPMGYGERQMKGKQITKRAENYEGDWKNWGDISML